MPSSLVRLQYFLRETSSILLTGRTPPSSSSGGRGRSTSAYDSQEWRVGATDGDVTDKRRKQEQEGVSMTQLR